MTLSARQTYLSIDEYLSWEVMAAVRHEYVAGRVFPLASASEGHKIIAGNLFARIHGHLRGTGCRVFQANMKLRLDAEECVYYPDLMATSEPVEAKSAYKTAPCLVIEVMSPGTRRTDLGEKRLAYRKIESLREYAVVHQDRRLIDLYRRDGTGKWQAFTIGTEQKLILNSLPNGPLDFTPDDIYQDVPELAG